MTLPPPTPLTDEIAEWKAYIHHPDRIHTTLWLANQLTKAERFITSLTTRAEAAESALEIQKGAVEIQGGELARATEEYAKVLARAESLEAELKRAREALTTCAATFREYAQLHRAKNTEDADIKARRNEEMMTMCSLALLTTPQS